MSSFMLNKAVRERTLGGNACDFSVIEFGAV